MENLAASSSHQFPKNKPIPKVGYLSKLKQRLQTFVRELPIVGFNSGKYDLNVIKRFMYPFLLASDPISFIVKKNSCHMAIKTEQLIFLDIVNYLAPGFSYNAFLKAYHCSQTKGFFPYEWLDSLEKLDHTTLPPHEAFHSTLKNINVTTDEYSNTVNVCGERRV